MSCSLIAFARNTFSPVKSQHLPDCFWLVMPLVFTLSEKWVSIIAWLAAFSASTEMEVVFRALRTALSVAVF